MHIQPLQAIVVHETPARLSLVGSATDDVPGKNPFSSFSYKAFIHRGPGCNQLSGAVLLAGWLACSPANE